MLISLPSVMGNQIGVVLRNTIPRFDLLKQNADDINSAPICLFGNKTEGFDQTRMVEWSYTM